VTHPNLLEGFTENDFGSSGRIAGRSVSDGTSSRQLTYWQYYWSAGSEHNFTRQHSLKGVDTLLVGIFDMLDTGLFIETPWQDAICQ